MEQKTVQLPCLLVPLLHFSCSYIIENGIPKNVVQGIFLSNSVSRFADDHCKLCFIVHELRPSMWILDCSSRANDRLWCFCEYDHVLQQKVSEQADQNQAYIPDADQSLIAPLFRGQTDQTVIELF
jgi:hypothetical protein